jgi:hypothetical protein
MAKPEWITIGTTEGSMNGSSEITAAAYTGRVAREGTITGTTAGGATDTTAVSQVGADEVITVEKKTYTVAAVGQKITIQGKSNSAALCLFVDNPGMIQSAELAIAGVKDTNWDGVENTQVTGDPGADAIYDFTLTVTVPENLLEFALVAKFSINNANDTVTSGEITVNQAAGVKNYAIPTISAFAYPEGNIPASGGSKTPTLSYSQTWGWNESNTNGGTISGTLAAPASGTTFAFSGTVVDATTGVVTAASKGTVVSGVTEVDAVTVTVTLNGKTSASSASVSVKQAANAASYGDVNFSSRVPSATDIPASGGSIGSSNITWSGEGAIATQTISYTSGATVNISNDAGSETPAFEAIAVTYSAAVSATSKGTAVSARTEAGVITITATGAGEQKATKSLTVYQAANSATYGEVTIGQATPVSLNAPGETYQIVPAMKQTVTYTSGATRTEATPEDNKVQLSADYTVKTAKEGFSLETNTGKVTVGLNPTAHERGGFVVTISAEGEGGKTATKDITFNQQGSSSTLDLSPDTMSFIAAGETKTLTITSNDSWTLS